MDFKIESAPEFSMLTVSLDSGESIVAESGAMVAMTPGIDIKTSARGGMLASLKRKFLGGESIFQNQFTANANGQHISFSPPTMGDIVQYELDGTGELLLQSSAYIASTEGIKLDTSWQGFKGFFSGNGLFLIKVTGSGTVFFSTYGAIHPIDIDGQYVIDTGHVVAFESSLDYGVKSVGGIKSLFFSGEGLVCRFSGRGRVWLQTRKPPRLAEFLNPFRPVESSNDDD